MSHQQSPYYPTKTPHAATRQRNVSTRTRGHPTGPTRYTKRIVNTPFAIVNNVQVLTPIRPHTHNTEDDDVLTLAHFPEILPAVAQNSL